MLRRRSPRAELAATTSRNKAATVSGLLSDTRQNSDREEQHAQSRADLAMHDWPTPLRAELQDLRSAEN
jgi:hypothetical protein